MGEWKSVRIGDVLKEVSRETMLDPNTKYRLLGVKWYGKGVFLREEKYGKEIKATKLYEVKQGDFIYNRLFAWKSSFAIVPDAFNGCLVSNEFPLFACREGKLLPEFLLSYMLLPENIASVNNLSGGMSSVSRKRFKEKDFLNFEVPQYDIEIQTRICQRLKKMSELSITQDLESAHQLSRIKQLRQRILQDAVEGRLTAKWRVQHPDLISGDNHASKLLEKIKTEKERLIKEGNTSTKLSARIKKDLSRAQSRGKQLPPISDDETPFDLPDGWVWCRLGDICSKIGSGSTPKGSNYSAEGIPFFRSQNIHDNGLVYDDIKFISLDVHKQMSGTVVLAGDLLLNITGGSLGRCASVPLDFNEGNVSQHVCIIRAVVLSKAFIHKLTLSPLFQEMVFQFTTGAGREGLPKYNLEQFIIPLPSLVEQQAITERVDNLMGMLDELEKQVSERKEQFEMLMQSVLREAFAG